MPYVDIHRVNVYKYILKLLLKFYEEAIDFLPNKICDSVAHQMVWKVNLAPLFNLVLFINLILLQGHYIIEQSEIRICHKQCSQNDEFSSFYIRWRLSYKFVHFFPPFTRVLPSTLKVSCLFAIESIFIFSIFAFFYSENPFAYLSRGFCKVPEDIRCSLGQCNKMFPPQCRRVETEPHP